MGVEETGGRDEAGRTVTLDPDDVTTGDREAIDAVVTAVILGVCEYSVTTAGAIGGWRCCDNDVVDDMVAVTAVQVAGALIDIDVCVCDCDDTPWTARLTALTVGWDAEDADARAITTALTPAA